VAHGVVAGDPALLWRRAAAHRSAIR